MSEQRSPTGAAFWVAAAVGWAVIAFGIAGVFDRLGPRGALDVGIWVVGGNIVHDVLVAPIALAVATGIALVVPRPWRAPLIAGLAANAVVVAVAYPALRGFGRKPNNPSVLPLDYDTAVLTVLAVVWSAVAVWYGVLLIERRRSPTRR
jgi:hypothetical protein